MNKFIQAIKGLDYHAVEAVITREPNWLQWREESGKNALHYLCAIPVGDDEHKADASVHLMQLLLNNGMDINSVHRIPDPACGFFPATPLWYAYTRGRNQKLYSWLLENGADPQNCMYAIAWYNDVPAADLFKKHGAKIDDRTATDTPFMAAFNWRRFEMAEWLLQHGANVNFADEQGNTALYYAVKRKYKTEPITMLLKFGANFNLENKDGVSPKKLAEANRQLKLLSLFK